jgi:hypothetical protein
LSRARAGCPAAARSASAIVNFRNIMASLDFL